MRRLELSGFGVAVTLLGVLAVIQLGSFIRGDMTPQGLQPGDPAPGLQVQTLYAPEPVKLLTLLQRNEGCHVLVMMDVNCSFCARFRYTWTDRYNAWSDSVGGATNPYWLFRVPRCFKWVTV